MTVTTRTTDTTPQPTATTPAGPGRPGRVRPNRRGPIKYEQVAGSLREKIATGELGNGDPVGSEQELMNEYGISRGTARAAIDVLRSEGLVVVHMGRGSFVRRPSERPTRTHVRAIARTTRGGYTDASETDQWHTLDPMPLSGTAGGTVGGTFRTDASADLALALAVPEHTPVFVYERLLAGPTGQRMIHRLYLPFATAADTPALTRDPFRTPTDLYKILDKTHPGALAWTEAVRARMPTPADAAALRIPDATPVLITRRTTTDTTTGRPLALEEVRVSAEDTQLTYTLTPTT